MSHRVQILWRWSLAASLAWFAIHGATQAQGVAQGPVQRPGKPWKVLLVSPGPPADAVVARLARSGYVENQQIVYERVLLGPDTVTKLTALAQRAESFDAALAVTNPAVRAVRQAFPRCQW